MDYIKQLCYGGQYQRGSDVSMRHFCVSQPHKERSLKNLLDSVRTETNRERPERKVKMNDLIDLYED